MFKKTSRIILASVLTLGTIAGGLAASVKQATAAAAPIPFSDIKGHWAEENIIKAKDIGLIDGFPDGTFRPDDVVSADQFITMMLRGFSKTYNTADGPQVMWDKDWMKNLAQSQPGLYGTIKNATGDSGFNFQPADSGYWAKPFVDMLYDMELLFPFDPVFPKKYEAFEKQITREKASYLLGKWYTAYEKNPDAMYTDFVDSHSGLTDLDSFSNSPVRAYRATMLISGLIVGYEDQTFRPQRYVTRAEALTMILRLRDPSLREPYTPDLTGQMYVKLNGNIYLFEDQFKFDMYNKIVQQAKEKVTTGYVAQGALGVGIYDSENTYEKAEFYTRMGIFENVPSPEFSVGVGDGNAKAIEINYPINHQYPNSTAFADAAFDLLAGNEKGSELQKTAFGMESELTGKWTYFTFNNQKFRMMTTGKVNLLDLLY